MEILPASFGGKTLALTLEDLIGFTSNWENLSDVKSLVKQFEKDLQSIGFDWFGFRYIPMIGAQDYKQTGHFFIPARKRATVNRNIAFLFASDDIFETYSEVPTEKYIHESGRAIWLEDLIKNQEFESEAIRKYFSLVKRDYKNAIATAAFAPGRARGSFFLVCPEVYHRPNETTMALIEYLTYRFLLKFRELYKRDEGELLNKITPRETDILNLLPHGLSNKEIAQKLKLSPNTVDGYLKTIFIKLDVQDRMGATLRWLSFTNH